MKSKKACATPTAKLTDEQINEDLENAARAGSIIVALTKGITDCPACSELALIMALAAMMRYNKSEPQDAIGLLQGLMEQKTLMETVFDGTKLAVIPAEELADAMKPRNPQDIQ